MASGFRRTALCAAIVSTLGTPQPKVSKLSSEAYRRARKDGLWDADCDSAYERLESERATIAEAAARLAQNRSGDGVLFSAAGDDDFVRREVLPAGRRLKAMRQSADWPQTVSTALFVEPRLTVEAEVGSCFDRVIEATRSEKGPPGFRVKAAKILAMASSPFERTIYLDFDSTPCLPRFATILLAMLGKDGELALADNYEGQSAFSLAQDLKREHASGCVVMRSSSPRLGLMLARYTAAHRALRSTRRGRRDQPALMVALRMSVLEDGLQLRHIPEHAFCRKNTSKVVACDYNSSCVVAHKPARYDTGSKIFGIGFKKTGTTSLAAALRELKIGPEPPHNGAVAASFALLERNDSTAAVNLAANYRAFADAPWCMAASHGGLLERLARTYPRAKFVLTRRPTHDWWISTRNWLACLKPYNAERYAAMLGASNLSRAAFSHAYEAYNARAIETFRKTQPDRLLVLDLHSGDHAIFPWAKLCEFVEAWGACPDAKIGNAANAYLKNEFSVRHPDAAPRPASLTKCSSTLVDDDAALTRAIRSWQGTPDSDRNQQLTELIERRRSYREKLASKSRSSVDSLAK